MYHLIFQHSFTVGTSCDVRTVAFHALVYQAVEERATVVTEGWAGVRVDLKLVFAARILSNKDKQIKNMQCFTLNESIRIPESTCT